METQGRSPAGRHLDDPGRQTPAARMTGSRRATARSCGSPRAGTSRCRWWTWPRRRSSTASRLGARRTASTSRPMHRVSSLVVALLLTATVWPAQTDTRCTGTVYLTFDTGNMAQAETIARILRQEQGKATLFLAHEKTFRDDHALDPAWRDYWRDPAAAGPGVGNPTVRPRPLERQPPGG